MSAEKCRVCGAEIYGYAQGGMPLCKEHFIKVCQLTCFYPDKDNCPYEGTDEEWAAAGEIVQAAFNKQRG